MTTFGVTPTGFVRKTYGDIQSSLFGYWRSKISKFLKLTDKTGLGNVGNGVVTELDKLWQAAVAAYNAGDPDTADEAAFEAICAITGTERRGAQKGIWQAVCNLGVNRSYAPGALVGNVAGQATNRWVNRDPVTSTDAGNYPVTFVSEKVSSAAIGSTGTLVIAQPIDGWLGVSTAVDATAGLDVESLDELALRRVTELQGSGSGPVAAIVARVSKIPGVVSVRAVENKTDAWDLVNSVPPHAYRVVVWDGISPGALDNDIAAAILAAGTSGIPSVGSSSGVAGGKTIAFDRAAQVPIYVTCTVTGTATAADVQAAVIAAGASLTSGNNVVAAKIRASITDTPGVADLLDFKIGTAASPSTAANIPISLASIGLFSAGRIDVTLL